MITDDKPLAAIFKQMLQAFHKAPKNTFTNPSAQHKNPVQGLGHNYSSQISYPDTTMEPIQIQKYQASAVPSMQ